MATSTGSRALDFALGLGAYAPELDIPEEVAPQEGGITAALPHRAGKLSPHAKEYEPLIQAAAQKYNLSPDLLRSLIQRESSFNPAAKSGAGAMGLSQLMPGTAAQYGVKNPYDPEQNVMGGAHYLSDMMRRYNNNPELALAAYNAGPGNVDKHLKYGTPLPGETQAYVPAVMGGQSQMPAVPAAQAVPEGMRVVTLTNGRELEVPAEMTDEQVMEQIRKSPNPEMSNMMPAREATIGGQTALVPFNMGDDEAMHHLVNQGSLPDPMAAKGGRGWNNLVSGFEKSLGNAALAMGNPEMARQFYEKAKAGEYQMYESEVEAAKKKGFLPGLKAEAMQNLVYPGMEMLGQFAPAMLPVSPAAKVGLMYPSAKGEIMHRGEEEGKPVSEADAALYGLPLAAVEALGLPIKGAGKLVGREAEEAAIKGMVERGAIEEAEQAALGSRAADLAQAYGTNVAKNVAAMGAMEGIQRGAMGESMLPQSMEDVTSLIEPAAWFSLPHGALEGLGARGAREEVLARESAKREPVAAEKPAEPAKPVEPEVVSEPEITPPESRTELQNIGEMYGRHVMEAEARGEPPMSPEDFMAQHKPEPIVEEGIKDELAPGDIEAAPSSEIIQPSPFVRKVQERKNAQQEPSAGPTDGGRRAQPEVREEGRDQAVSSEGVEPSGQRFEAPEIVRQEVKAPEAEVKRTFPKTKPPEEVTLPYIPKSELEKMEKEQVVAYHQMRGEQLRRLTADKAKTLPERDQIDYHQYKGLSNAEIAKQMGYSGKEETIRKLEEHGLQNLDIGLSKAREDYLEAQREERAKYREAESAPEAVYEGQDRVRDAYKKGYEDNGFSYENGVASIDTDKHKMDVDHAGIAVESKDSSHMDGIKRLWSNRNDEIELSTPSGHFINIDLDKGIVDLKVRGKDGTWLSKETYYRDFDNLESPDLLVDKRLNALGEEGIIPKDLGEKIYSAVKLGPQSGVYGLLHDLGVQDVHYALKAEREIVNALEEIHNQPPTKRTKRTKTAKEVDEVKLSRKKEKEEAKRAQEEYDREEEERKKEFEQDEEGIYELPDFDYTEPDRELDYSKGVVPKNAHTPETLAKHLTDTYGARKPAVEVTTRAQAGVDAKTKAFYDPKTKKVHIIADNLDKGDNVHGLLKHEIGVHAQKLGVKDPEFQGILKHMQGMRDKGIQAVREAYAKVPEGTRPERVHEEALGYLVEHHPHIPLVRRFMSWLRRMAHKLTGHAGWLKPEDLSHMASRILKKDYGAEARPERRDVKGEKLRSVRDDNLRAVREMGITKTEPKLTYKETAQEAVKAAKSWKDAFRTQIIDTTDPLTRALQKLDTFDKDLGKFRADVLASEANQAVGLVGHAIENGTPTINESGAMMVKPGANLKHAVEFAKSKEKNGEELLSYVLRVNIGEHRLKEHAQDIADLKRIAKEILELKGAVKFHDKLNQGKERKLAEKALANKESAYNTIIRERNIDPETMEGREKLVNAEMIALKDKLMKDHPWLKEATQEVYDAMDALVDFQHQAGMIDKLTADKWKAAPYVPLYKSLADLEKDPNFNKLFPRSAEALSQVKQIKGFKHSVNMLENLHKHYYGMMLPAVFNHVRREAVNQMLHLDALEKTKEGLEYNKALRKSTEAMQKSRGGPGTVKVMENGEEKHFHVEDPDLLEMLAFNRVEIGAIAKMMQPATSLLRLAYLKNPAFWAKQLFAEPIYANFLTGNKNLIHPGQAVGNLIKIWLGKSEGAKVLERHGVDVGYHAFGGDKAFSYEGAGEATQFHELIGKKSWAKKAAAKWDRIHNSVDEAVRVTVYNAAVKDGKSLGLKGQSLEDYAVNKARSFINFSARGKSKAINEYRAAVAFSSAAINGLDAIVKNATGYGLNAKEAARVKSIFWKRVMAGTAIGTGLALWEMTDNPQAANESDLYEKLTTFRVPGTDMKLPAPWDIGAAIYGVPKLMLMSLLLDKASPYAVNGDQALKGFAELAYKNVLPPLPIPSAIAPGLEAAVNFSFDNMKAIEGPGAQMMAPDARGRMNSAMGEMVGSLFGSSGKIGDHIGRGYLGKVYDVMNGIADLATDRTAGMPVSKYDVAKKVGLGQFVVDETRVAGADRIYDAAGRAQEELNAFNKFRTSGDKEKLEAFKKDPERMKFKQSAGQLRYITSQLSVLERRITQIRNSKQPDAVKEMQITQINAKKREAIARGNASVKRILGDYAP